jgi:Flp pilus assembly CpaE family ATPase
MVAEAAPASRAAEALRRLAALLAGRPAPPAADWRKRLAGWLKG